MMGQAMDPDWLAAMRRVRRAVVFTGAGVSAESGIATFRDALSGLWARYDPASMATAEAFAAEPDLVWGWYQWRLRQVAEAQPNPAHRAIAALATRVEQLTVVTQNVDDLHERAGSCEVIHLHGSLSATRCFDCARPHQLPNDVLAEVAEGQRVSPPQCGFCGGWIRPGVVWFGEMLPDGAFEQALDAAGKCDLLLAVGTSGQVYPAAHIPQHALASGAWLVHVNPDPIAPRAERERALQGPAGHWLPQLLELIGDVDD